MPTREPVARKHIQNDKMPLCLACHRFRQDVIKLGIVTLHPNSSSNIVHPYARTVDAGEREGPWHPQVVTPPLAIVYT